MPKRITKGNLWGFIQSRPYASVADIRRLFLVEVDDASALETSEGTCYIGLPPPAASLIRQLWQEGRILLDLNPDVKARVVQGVYPTRVPPPRASYSRHAAESSLAVESEGTARPKRKRRRKRKPADGDASGGDFASDTGAESP